MNKKTGSWEGMRWGTGVGWGGGVCRNGEMEGGHDLNVLYTCMRFPKNKR